MYKETAQSQTAVGMRVCLRQTIKQALHMEGQKEQDDGIMTPCSSQTGKKEYGVQRAGVKDEGQGIIQSVEGDRVM